MSASRILVVDDDPAIHEVLDGYLGISGYALEHAENGEEGVEKMLAHPPDLLIVDVQMPILDGFGLLERVKANPLLAHIPVIMLSSLNRPNIKVKGLQLGADDYVVKPFDASELMARVSVALRRSLERQELEDTFSGRLGEVTLVELLQTMAHGDKSGRIQLLDMDAEILLHSRSVVSIRLRTLEGPEALKRLLLAEHGRFRIHFEKVDATEIVGSIEDLLLSSLVAIDELKESCGDLRDGVLVPGSGDFHPELKLISGDEISWPARSETLLAMMEGSLEENISLLRSLVSQHLLEVTTDEGNE